MNLIKLWDLLTKKEPPPLCADCRHSHLSRWLPGTLYCRSPYVDPVGEPEMNMPCVSSRRYYCKPSGRYFEPKASEPEYMGEER